MTVHRVKTCACGHPVDWHDKETGRCTYGRDRVTGGCTCERVKKRGRAAAVNDSMLVDAIEATIRSLTALRDALDRADEPVVNENGVVAHVATPIPRRHRSKLGASKLGRKILIVLAQHPAGLSKVQIALMAGYSHTSGGFRNYLSAMRTARLIEGGNERMRITEAGRRELGVFDALPTRHALLAYWQANAGWKCERMILGELAGAHPMRLTKEALAIRAGYQATSGGFRNACSRLRTLQLITGRGELGLSTDFAGAIA